MEVALLHWGSKGQMESLSEVTMSLCWALSYNVQIPDTECLDQSIGLHAHLLAKLGRIFDQKFYWNWSQGKIVV